MPQFFTISTRSIRAAALGLLASVTLAPIGALAQGDDPLRETHGDWSVRCVNDTACYMEQTLRNQEGAPVLAMRVQKLSGVATSDGRQVDASALIVAPLGVFLPEGLRLDVDGTVIGAEPFLECQPSGCISNPALTSEIVGRLKGGAVANFRMRLMRADQPSGVVVTAPISLTGFTAAFDSL